MTRARNRLADGITGDDGFGSQPLLGSYMDDTSGTLAHYDVAFFFEEFQRLGPPKGIHLSPTKNIIITSTNGQSPLPFLRGPLKRQLRTVISTYCKEYGEITDGTKLLG